jgi:hypothetical protein
MVKLSEKDDLETDFTLLSHLLYPLFYNLRKKSDYFIKKNYNFFFGITNACLYLCCKPFRFKFIFF